jgi:RND family efflux transporter MFP subunit
MMRRIKWLTGVLLVLMVVAGCGGGASREEEATPTPIPTPIVPTKPTYEVKRGEVVRELEFTGRIAPVVEEELFFRTAGYVGTVYVERDDFVETGDLLAELEVIDLKNQLLQAEAALEMAIANNEKRLAEAEASLRSTELRVASARADNPASQVTIAEVGLERAKIALSEAQEAYDEAWDPGRDWELDIAWKKKALENEREATERALRQAELSLKVAKAQVQQALQSLEKHQYNVEICEHEVELARLRLEQLEAGLDIEEIKLNVQRLRDLLNDAQLKAPFDGQVLSLSITDGRAVEGYRPVMVIGELSELEVSASLQGSQMEDLQEGMPVAVTIASRPGEEIKGQIRRLPYPYGGGGRISSDAEERDESSRVSLDVSATDAGLELGDLVRMTVVLERKDDVLWLPPQAIRIFEGRRFVVLQEGDAQRRVDVQIGVEGEDRVEIEEGLAEGQVVIGP